MIAKLKSLNKTDVEYLCSEIGEPTEKNVPKRLLEYRDQVWQDNTECSVFMASVDGELGMLAVVDFCEIIKGNKHATLSPFDDVERMAHSLLKEENVCKVKNIQILLGYRTGLSYYVQGGGSEDAHTIEMFFPIGTPKEDIYPAMWQLCQFQN